MGTLITKQEGMLVTDSSALRNFVTPEALAVPGNFYLTDTLNMFEAGLVQTANGYQRIDDNEAHLLNKILVQSSIEGMKPIESSFFTVQGNPLTEGAAFGVIVGNLDDLKEVEGGPLFRAHSSCGYSEMGIRLTNLLYGNPAWLLDNTKELYPAFIKHGDGIAMAYPNLEIPEESRDCDCQSQRLLAQAVIAAAGGIYVSLSGDPQEARGFGIEMKQRMYALQSKYGFDTDQTANFLEIPSDIRRYDHVGRYMFEVLGLKEIRLLSNNPRKAEALSRYVKVNLVPLMPTDISEEAQKYVMSKAKLGHLVNAMTNFSFEMGMLQLMLAAPYSTPDISVLNESAYNNYRF